MTAWRKLGGEKLGPGILSASWTGCACGYAAFCESQIEAHELVCRHHGSTFPQDIVEALVCVLEYEYIPSDAWDEKWMPAEDIGNDVSDSDEIVYDHARAMLKDYVSEHGANAIRAVIHEVWAMAGSPFEAPPVAPAQAAQDPGPQGTGAPAAAAPQGAQAVSGPGTGAPCPTCAHTDHPGAYIGAGSRSEPCPTCGGACHV